MGQRAEAKKPQGKIKCPPQSDVDPTTLRIGDYVVIDLAATVGTFHEMTWARLIGSAANGQFEAKLIGEAGEYGQPKALRSTQHGFKLGQTVRFFPVCVLESYRPIPKPGRVLCAGELPVQPKPDLHIELLNLGDFVELVVKSREGQPERLWAEVVDLGPQQQVLYGVVITEPVMTDHGYKQGDQIVFLRDCIIDISFEVAPTGPVE